MSIVDRNLMSIQEDQEALFVQMSETQISEDDFQRRVLHIASRYDEILATSPNNIDMLILYGKFLRRINQNDKANLMFSHADTLDENIAVVKQQIGNYLAETGDYAEALAYYLRAVELDPAQAVYHYGIGELLATFRDKFVADGIYSNDLMDKLILEAFSKASAIEPANKDFLFRNGEAYYDLHTPRWDEALALWTVAGARSDLTSFEKDVVRLHKARVLCELGRDREALELLHDEVIPFLAATRTRLLKRITDADTPTGEDKAAAVPEPTDAQTPPAATK